MTEPTVSHEHDQRWDDVVRLWERTKGPEGTKVEIIEEIVTVKLPPVTRHTVTASRISRRVCSVVPDDWRVHQTLAIAVPSRFGMFIPDLVVVPEQRMEGSYVPAAAAELVVEVTSKFSTRQDRISKPAAYAAAGIPLYLLVDHWALDGPAVTLYGEPRGGLYRVLRAVKFGETIKLPAPSTWTSTPPSSRSTDSPPSPQHRRHHKRRHRRQRRQQDRLPCQLLRDAVARRVREEVLRRRERRRHHHVQE